MKKVFRWFLVLLLLVLPLSPVYAKESKEEKKEETKVTKKDKKKKNVQIINLDKASDDEEGGDDSGVIYHYQKNGFEINITGYVLDVYEVNEDSPIVKETSKDGTATTENTEDEIKYRDGNLFSSYEIPEEFYSKNVKVETGKLYDVDALFVDTDLQITKEDLEEILEEEMGLATETKQFLVDLSVEYEIASVPSDYSYLYTYDLVRILQSLAVLEEIPEYQLGAPGRQVINRITITKEENKDAVLSFPKDVEERNKISFMNYIGVSSHEISIQSDPPEYYIMFHNVNNVKELMDQDEGDNPQTATMVDDIVPIPDTGKMASVLYYIEGILFMIIGAGIIYSTVIKKQKNVAK